MIPQHPASLQQQQHQQHSMMHGPMMPAPPQQAPPFIGPHPAPIGMQQQSPPLSAPPFCAAPIALPHVAPAPPSHLKTFSVQMTNPRIAAILVRAEDFEPLHSWMPFIHWGE